MINWRIVKHPANWLNLAAMAIFWVAVVYLGANGVNKLHSNKSQGAP